jgi:hypothetical protein
MNSSFCGGRDKTPSALASDVDFVDQILIQPWNLQLRIMRLATPPILIPAFASNVHGG